MVEHQKVVAKGILDKLECIDPYCILAGGAPRDWYFGNEANDLDFYIYITNHWTLNMVCKQLDKFGIKVNNIKTGENMPISYKLHPHLRYFFDIESEIPTQIMVMKLPTFETVVPSFPLNVCQAWWKGGNIHVTKDFLLGERFKAIFKTNQIYANDHKYLQKILSRFNDWEYFNSKTDFINHL